jgi:hypothetical protein
MMITQINTRTQTHAHAKTSTLSFSHPQVDKLYQEYDFPELKDLLLVYPHFYHKTVRSICHHQPAFQKL